MRKKLPPAFLLLLGALATPLPVALFTPAPVSASDTLGADLFDLPSDAEGMGKILCAEIDLTQPGLEEVKRQADQGQGHYAAALTAWRDYKVAFLRKADPGDFGWHADQVSQTRLALAEDLVGRLSAEQQAKIDKRMRLFFVNSGIVGDPDAEKPLPIQWLAQDDRGAYFENYQNFYFSNGLSVRYWQSGDAIYLRKWFQIAADFARNQKHEVDALDDAIRRRIPCNWSARDAQASLSQSDRVHSLIRNLSVFCKSLPESGKPEKWSDVCRPLATPLAPAARDVIPPVELAQIALSLVRDHPPALLARYVKAGAVPNQRRNGLSGVLLIAATFPEFSASRELAAQGAAGLDSYLQGAFHRDGGMLEQSFNYNLGDASSLEEMAAQLEPSQPELAAKLRKRALAFYRIAAALSTPGAYLPAMASYGPASPPPFWSAPQERTKWLANHAAKMPGLRDPLVALIAGQFQQTPPSPAPAFTSITFPYSGYAVQRRSWGWESPYLFMQTCRPGRGHRSMGHNAIQVFAYGRPFLVSCGVPVYSPAQLPEAMRGDFDAINGLLGEGSSWKTNTVLVDDHSQKNNVKANQEAQPTPIEARWHTSSQFDFTEGLYDLGYPEQNIDHQRQVIFVRDPGFWIVTDRMTNRDGNEHAFTQVWNFPPFLDEPRHHLWGFTADQVVTDPTARQLHTADPNGPNLWLYHFGAPALDYAKHYGDKSPYRGWYTLGFGSLTPAPNVNVSWKSPGHSLLVTVIWPAPDAATPLLISRDLTPRGDATRAGLSLKLPDGRLLTYQAAHDPQSLTASRLTVRAKGLLTVESPGGITHGLVLNSNPDGNTPTDYEFTAKGEAKSEVIPITTPQGFHWQQTPAGLAPDYGPQREENR